MSINPGMMNDGVVSTTFTTAGETYDFDCEEIANLRIQFVGNYTGEILFYKSTDGSNFDVCRGLDDINFTGFLYSGTNEYPPEALAPPLSYLFNVVGLKTFRLVGSSGGTGSFTCTIRSSLHATVFNGFTNSVAVIGSVSIRNGVDDNPIAVGQQTMVNSFPVVIASDQSAIPITDNGGSLTVDGTITANQGTNPWIISGTVTADTEMPAAAALADTTANPTTPTLGADNLIFNGTTWDRMRGDIANGVDVDVTRSVLPTGAATSALQTQPGVDIGDVTINNAAGAAAVNIQDGGNSITVDGTVAATQSGTWNITNISGTVSLPTGASTAANQTTEITSLQLLDNVVGPVTPGTVATNSTLIGGQFNTTLPTLTDTQQSALQLDSRGRLLASNVPLQGVAQTYSAAGLVTSAALATDIFSITGSATKTIAIVGLTISGVATAATVSTVNIVKRSTANSVGTPTTLTNVPSDSTNAAATATVVSYAGVPTTGTLVGNIRTIKIFLPPPSGGNANTPSMPIIGPQSFSQPIILRGTGQVLAINLAGVTIAGAVLACAVDWIEY